MASRLFLVITVLVLSEGILCAQESPHGTLSIPCERCHSTQAWSPLLAPLAFSHNTTGFPLEGRHSQVSCRQCHRSLDFAKASGECVSCHADIHRGELGKACERCHAPRTWLVPEMADRHRDTRFPLLGAHRTAPCRSCHVNEQKYEFAGAPTACFECHKQEYRTATAPNHLQAGFGVDCVQCHTPTALTWGGTFDHSQTAFPLAGAHRAVPCVQCHTGNRFRGTPQQCSACHMQQFNNSVNPPHAASGFSTDCRQCHSLNAWRPATFNHATTGFALTGAHAAVACLQCHQNYVYQGTPTLCNSCHQADYAGVQSPRHTLPSFSTDCTACHTTAVWKPSSFNHGVTKFPLSGTHATTACASCHINGVYAGTPLTCVGCHQQDYNRAANPNHVTSGLPTDCQSCHSTTAWQPATFDHSKTAFPLTGAHLATPCNQCHVNNVYKGTPAQCYACHQQDYAGVASPKHTQPSFATDCTACHTTTAWRPSTFDHSKTSYPLTGAHVQVTCSACHINGQYAGTSKLCSGCHMDRYNATANPNHLAAGFPNDCTLCHNTTAWSPSSWNHDPYFPIGSTATHRPGRWTTCADCHTVATDFKTFSCINCHAHDKTTTDSHHTQVRNYSYDSQACYSCHPRGSGG